QGGGGAHHPRLLHQAARGLHAGAEEGQAGQDLRPHLRELLRRRAERVSGDERRGALRGAAPILRGGAAMTILIYGLLHALPIVFVAMYSGFNKASITLAALVMTVIAVLTGSISYVVVDLAAILL